MFSRAETLLQGMLGPRAAFRAGQWEAIELLALKRQRLLVVQRTGWGKSIVYFLASKLLREGGGGPTLLISPLLSLMRNQIEMARRIGVRAATIHSGNREEWEQAESALAADACDVLLISPERLNNERFVGQVLPRMAGRIGLFVVDEAHCISDWGHDFRPDYRRIVRILHHLPQGVPVLSTTATANNRVVHDVQQQLGPRLHVCRGPLARPSVRLQNLSLGDQSERLEWLAENLPRFKGHGIIYCLTVSDCERVSRWLKANGMSVEAYHAALTNDERVAREQALLENRVQALVATVALGMGFDKPDLQFVIHFQRPGSVVAYYQQVGRAGRAIDPAYGILLSGREDDDILVYFIRTAFPPPEIMQSIVQALARSAGLTQAELLPEINASSSLVEKALKLLELDGAVGKDGGRYFRTPNPWAPDLERIEHVTAQRRSELAEMKDYVQAKSCLMELLTRALDDPAAQPCGVCANCQGRGFRAEVDPRRIAAAVQFLKRENLVVEPRLKWPAGLFPDAKITITEEHRNAPGRVLCFYGDAGWGRHVREGKYVHGRFGDDLVEAACALIRDRWKPSPFPEWLTAIPSRRHPRLTSDFAARLAGRLGIPFLPVLGCVKDVPEQKTLQNSVLQARNVRQALALAGRPRSGPVLLVDDIIDSRWTMTLAGWLLRTGGSGLVYPFALARATPRDN